MGTAIGGAPLRFGVGRLGLLRPGAHLTRPWNFEMERQCSSKSSGDVRKYLCEKPGVVQASPGFSFFGCLRSRKILGECIDDIKAREGGNISMQSKCANEVRHMVEYIGLRPFGSRGSRLTYGCSPCQHPPGNLCLPGAGYPRGKGRECADRSLGRSVRMGFGAAHSAADVKLGRRLGWNLSEGVARPLNF